MKHNVTMLGRSFVPTLLAPLLSTLMAPVPGESALASPVIEHVPIANATSTRASSDRRIVILPFRANHVIKLTNPPGVEAVVMLGSDEHIDNVAIGDANAWQISPNKRANMLFFKPLNAHARTNLTVVSDVHTYFFDLIASPHARTIYALRFTYDDTEHGAGVKTAHATPPLTGEEAALARHDPGSTPIDPAALDFGWQISGTRALSPARIYSDGHNTYLSWSRDSPLPAILIRDAHGQEGPVNFSVHADMIVIDAVPHVIVLRADKAVATITHVMPRH